MGRGRGGVTPVQRRIDQSPNSIRIAKHLVVPEAENAIPLILDHSGAGQIGRGVMLAAIHLDDQLRSVASEICNEMTERDLSSEMMFGKAFAQDSPELAFGIRHLATQSSCASDRAWWRMMLHPQRSTPTITPPQPLPIEGRGSLAQLAILAAAAVDRRMGHRFVAFGLAGDAGADAGQGLAPLLGDELAAIVAFLGALARRRQSTGAQDRVLHRIVDLVLHRAVACPPASHQSSTSSC